MASGELKVYAASDESMKDIMLLAEAEGLRIADCRSRFPRWVAKVGWTLLTVYFMVAYYCQFKMALGLSTVACTCTQ